ncbi:STAM-binding protein-like A [Orchesella cincta]|uniref:STAM-binding protein-like A n=1 Tax=Orchesella cincta TaxID=48709 RepID=A0A1D2NFE5_ORCCI|nr:STAM-binding protein-like A [Orchesella cincta]
MIMTGPEMEAPTRVKRLTDSSIINVDPNRNPHLYLRSGRELIRNAASYQEDGQTEHAYMLYMRFLTIFLDKIRTHPRYNEIPPSERKLMSDYCNKILPQAEYLKKELLKKYEKEHAEYLVHVELLEKRAEELRRKEAKEARERAARETPKSRPHPAVGGFANIPSLRNDEDLFVPNPDALVNLTPGLPMHGAWTDPHDIKCYVDAMELAEKEANAGPSPSAPPQGPSTIPTPSVDRSTKPDRFMTPMSSGLRPIVVPTSLATQFLRLAQANNARNVETCGVLTGKISGARLIITDLIIPKQTGSSDTCAASNEMEIYDFQDKYNLITLGWIHTHPSQTAFLSSVDMHNQYGYQVMMPEAIAIVCAPKHNQTGTFTLTPEGMDEIGNCRASGFHPHAKGLFGEAQHYTLDPSVSVKVHDLRN